MKRFHWAVLNSKTTKIDRPPVFDVFMIMKEEEEKNLSPNATWN